MIPAALFQKNKKELKKQVSECEDDETPMRRKNKLKFTATNLIDFNNIAEQDDLIIEDDNVEQNEARVYQQNSLDFQQHSNNQSIQEENESSQSETPSKQNDFQLKLPKLNENIRRTSRAQELNSPEQEENSKEEPQAEPMGDVNSPQFPKLTGQNQPNEQLVKKEEEQSSDSEFDIFNPEKSVDKEVQQSNLEFDDKLNKLSQEASALDRILPYFIINPYGKFKSYWSGLMLVMLFYIVLILPVRLAFEQNPNEYIALDLTIDTIFFIDLTLTFFTAYEDERGIVIVEFKKIALNYIKGWFFLDLTATFPLYLILDSNTLPGASNVNSLLRLARLPRIYKLVGVLRVGNLIKTQAIQKLFFFLKLNKEYSLILRFIIITFIVIHLAGCFWFFIGSLTDETNNWIVKFNLAYSTGFEQYIASVYFVLTILVTVGYGNILPVNNIEYVFAIIFQFLGVAFFAYVMGTLTFTFAKLSQKVTMIKEREIFFNELAHTYSLPKETHERLLMSVQNSIFSHSNQMLEFYNEEEIFQDLPPIVQGMVCEFLFKDIIDKIRFLNGKPRSFLRRIFKYMVPTFLNKGDAIFFRGEPADFIYFVIKGRLVTKCEDQYGKSRTLVHVEGSYFGEVDILVSRARGESAIAETQAEVWKLAKKHFLRILDDFEDVKMELLDYAIKKEKSRKSTVKTIKNKEFLELLAKSKKDQIVINKQQFILKVKEKLIQQLQDITKSKSDSQGKELFSNVTELDKFLEKVADYRKICQKLTITDDDLNCVKQLKPINFSDPEVEDSLLKGLKVQSHLYSIQEYL